MLNLRKISILLLTLTSFQQAVAQPPEAAGVATGKRLDLILRSEITIDRPAKEVWPHFLNMEAWMAGMRLQHIDGPNGEVGEVRLVTSTNREKPENDYFIQTVRVTPLEQYVVKVVPKRREQYAGYADFSFTETDGKTRLIYDIYVDRPASPMSEEELRKLRDEEHANGYKSVDINNRNLKALVEKHR